MAGSDQIILSEKYHFVGCSIFNRNKLQDSVKTHEKVGIVLDQENKEIQSKFIIFQDLKTDRSKINIHGGNCDFLQISFITLTAG